MKPEITQPTVNSYSLPVYKVVEEDGKPKLSYVETTQTVAFVRPEITMVSKDNLEEAQEILQKLHEKESRTEEDDKAIQQLEDLVSKGETVLEPVSGVTVSDLLTVIRQELELLKANPQAIVKLEELKFWLTK